MAALVKSKAPKPWTKRDVARLRALAGKGVSSSVAAKRLGRTPGATRFKAMTERVSFTSLGQVHSRRQSARWAA